MSIFATVIPLCSEAISSSTGATILHGPHQDAQKSTSTGLSLPSTSSANDWSVTVKVDLSAMSSPVCGICLERAVAATDELSGHLRVLIGGVLGKPAFGVDGRRTTGAGGGDRLPVYPVDQVAGGKHPIDAGIGGRRSHLDVAVVVGVHLAADQLATRIVPDGHKHPGDVQGRAVRQRQAAHPAVTEH